MVDPQTEPEPRTARLPSIERGSGPPLVLVHGFAQNSRCWGPLDEQWATDHRVVAVDAPGHGGRNEVADDLWSTADRLALTGGRAVYLGYSMGARMCLHLALSHPEVVSGLILVSGTAGIEDATARAERRAGDAQLAAGIVVAGVDTFLEHWLSQPLFATLPPEMRHLEARRRNSAAGLASSLELAGTATMDPPLWDRLGEIASPTLVAAGALDTKFVDTARRLADGISGSTLALVEGAGHTVHLEQPDEFHRLVTEWMATAGL